MAFENIRKHNLDHIAFLLTQIKRDKVESRQAMEVATGLVQQGLHGLAESYMARHCSSFTHPGAIAYVESLRRQNLTISRFEHLPGVLGDKPLMIQLLDEHEPVFMQGTGETDRLLVILSTTYNNFYVSNAVLLALVKNFGCAVLFLKDSDANFFLKGAKGFGNSLDEMAKLLKDFVTQRGFKRVNCMGFSSSGYASLFCAISLNAGPHLGFSIRADYTEGSALPQGWLLREELKQEVPKHCLVNLAAMHKASGFQHCCTVYYGEDDQVDVQHALLLADCENVQLHAIAKTGHGVPARLLETDAFEKCISSFLRS